MRGLRRWSKDSKEARYARSHADRLKQFCETRSAEVIANIAICLIHQTNYLLDRQIRRLESDFIRNGGIRERMRQARLAHRG